MMKRIVSLLLVGVLSFGLANSVEWSPTTASVVFYIKNAGITVDGSFSGLRASVNFNPNDLANSSISASVAVKTIETDIDLRNKHLKGKDYFHEEKYPRISMESVSFSKTSGSDYNGKFKLTIKNVTKTISIPFTFTESNGTGTFKGEFELNRRDYTVGSSSWTLNDKVKIKLVLNASKKG